MNSRSITTITTLKIKNKSLINKHTKIIIKILIQIIIITTSMKTQNNIKTFQPKIQIISTLKIMNRTYRLNKLNNKYKWKLTFRKMHKIFHQIYKF